jgi:hypothetical protein
VGVIRNPVAGEARRAVVGARTIGSKLAATALVGALAAAAAVVPTRAATFPAPGRGEDPYDYTRLHIRNGACSGPEAATADLPARFDCRRDWKLSDYAPKPGDPDYDPLVATNPQEFHGVRGPGTNRAWEITTGRPDTVIAVLDSGIRWYDRALTRKVALNPGELPVPCRAAPCPSLRPADWRAYDTNRDGVFDVDDYAGDPRVADRNGNGFPDPQDLILAFSDGRDDDDNGYPDDIAGWDFFQRDNDPADDTDYGHGTGEAKDSAGDIAEVVTQCPNCRFFPLRVGNSFIADINHFAEAVIYAVDNGASVVQEALGTLNNSAFGQAAVDYAWTHGVLVVASAADEEAGHHNFPAALARTMVVNSVTGPVTGPGDVPVQRPASYLALNGCTNFGGYIWVAVASTSCSSDATGQASGIAGLLYSAARNAIAQGVIAARSDTAGRPLSAAEAKQLFRLAADDIDFSTPKPPGPPNNFATTLPLTRRYTTTAGWDQITGWGRINSRRLVELVNAGRIPPEAEITAPGWWAPLPASGRLVIEGRAAAPRAERFTWEVAWAPGVQPPPWPAADRWVTAARGASRRPVQGRLATIDLAEVRRAIEGAPPPYTPADDPTSPDLPERDAFRVRLIVRVGNDPATVAIDQRQFFARTDPDVVPGWPRQLRADGAGSPAFADLDGDGRTELILADGNGLVHAFRRDGTELPGWPVHTGAIPLPAGGRNAFTTGSVSRSWYAPVLLGAPTVADLDGDGRPEVAVADIEGALWVWDHRGRLRQGFPVHPDPRFSRVPGCQERGAAPACDEFSPHPVRDKLNWVDFSFSTQPAAGDLDPRSPGLELVIGAHDGHVYAWHADGRPVSGWPVLLRDPAKVAAVDPVTHRITYRQGANARYGREVLVGVSLGDVTGDGRPEVAAVVNEQYVEPPNISVLSMPTSPLLAQIAEGGNTRVYLLHPDGTRHPGVERVPNLGDNAYVSGWPVPVWMLKTELLPVVGAGSNGPAVFADVDGDGTPELAVASIATPPYLLRADGRSVYGNGPDGRPLTMAASAPGAGSAATDFPSVASLGGGVFGRLAGPGSPLAFAMGATGLRRLLDVVLPDQQLGAEDHVAAWDARTGQYVPGFPALMNDLMFFNTPAVGDVDGDGLAEVVQGSAVYDLRAYGLAGRVPSGWPKFTGGWVVGTPAFGDIDGDGLTEIAAVTREGWLWLWRTAGRACQPVEWPRYQHDLHNSGNYATDATPPAPVRGLAVESGELAFDRSGDDGVCGAADHYELAVDGAEPSSLEVHSSGDRLVAGLPELRPGRHRLTLWAVDEAGNRSFPATFAVQVARGGSSGGPQIRGVAAVGPGGEGPSAPDAAERTGRARRVSSVATATAVGGLALALALAVAGSAGRRRRRPFGADPSGPTELR